MIRRNGKMTLTLNKENYLRLLKETKIIPKIIETEEEYREYLAVTENLMAKKNQRTLEETTLFRLLVRLVEDYEEKFFNLGDWSDLPPHEILQHLVESSGMTENHLQEVISSDGELIGNLLNGQLAISFEQAQKLGTYFKVSPSLFCPS